MRDRSAARRVSSPWESNERWRATGRAGIARQAFGASVPAQHAFNVDGWLEQSDSPGADKARNWLPAPKAGAFKLALRLYVPKKQVANGTWKPPAVQRVK